MSYLKDDCYFCGKDARDSTDTVNGRPDDYKVCPECYHKNTRAIFGSRLMIAAYNAGYSSVADWKASGCPK